MESPALSEDDLEAGYELTEKRSPGSSEADYEHVPTPDDLASVETSEEDTPTPPTHRLDSDAVLDQGSLRTTLLSLHCSSSKEHLLLQAAVRDEIRRQRRQLLQLVAIVLVVLGLAMACGLGVLICMGAGGRPEVYHTLGIASKQELDALLPREERNARVLHDLSDKLSALAPKVEAFSEASQGMTMYLKQLKVGESFKELRQEVEKLETDTHNQRFELMDAHDVGFPEDTHDLET